MDRREMLSRAVTDCMREMYAKAQPSIDYDELLAKVESGEIIDTNENPVYNRHYLSMQEFDYIREKWADAYGLKPTWKPNIELLEDYLFDLCYNILGTNERKFMALTGEMG